MFRLELQRDQMRTCLLNKRQSRSIDYVEMAVFDSVNDVEPVVAALANEIHHELVYRIVPLGELACRRPHDQEFDIGGSD